MNLVTQTTAHTAKELLGKKLIIDSDGQQLSGYIVETEAYVGIVDEACHSYNGRRTPRIESMYMSGGTIYVYMMHTHHMLNIVTKEEGVPEAVLIRAIQPIEGEGIMSERRKMTGINITNGPGKLTKALGITKEANGTFINEGPIHLDETNGKVPRNILAGPRIGIPNKGEWTEAPLRFYVEGNPYVSALPKRAMKDAADTWK